MKCYKTIHCITSNVVGDTYINVLNFLKNKLTTPLLKITNTQITHTTQNKENERLSNMNPIKH